MYVIPVEEWTQVAVAPSFEELGRKPVPDIYLTKGTQVKFVLTLKLPVAKAFDLPGAELIFRPVIPPGLKLVDVWGEGLTTAIVLCEVDPNEFVAVAIPVPAWLPAVIAFVVRHWFGLSLVTIGILWTLGRLISAIAVLIRGEAAQRPTPFRLEDLFPLIIIGMLVFIFVQMRRLFK